MARKVITTFFTKKGAPETGLSPTITIRELDDINPATTTVVVNAQPMAEIGDGWYVYDFTSYDVTKSYTFVAEGGATLPDAERWQPGVNDSFQEEITDTVWNATATDYITLGTMGWLQNQAAGDTQQILINVAAATSLINTLLKYDQNRTKIDKDAKTLTIYDNDGTTPLKVFDLKNSFGNPSVTEVCERVPQP